MSSVISSTSAAGVRRQGCGHITNGLGVIEGFQSVAIGRRLMVKNHDAVKVVQLMLDAPRLGLVETLSGLTAIRPAPQQLHLFWARNSHGQCGDGQALLVHHEAVTAVREDLRIDKDHWRGRCLFPSHINNEHPLHHADLRRGQRPRPLACVHRLKHIADSTSNLRILWLNRRRISALRHGSGHNRIGTTLIRGPIRVSS